MRFPLAIALGALLVTTGCGGGGGECSGFEEPRRADTSMCADVSADDPTTLAECLRGSGHAGLWAIDSDGLPAYDFMVDQRCDLAAQSSTPSDDPFRDPIHLVGNGRGVVAMARASGAVELYSQDRGHKWFNRVDTWQDPENKDYPIQLGGGFNYLVINGKVHSTRFEDHAVGKATERQTRRFGVGYVETVTTIGKIIVTRRVYAPDANARALVVEVSLENTGTTFEQVGLVEFWDVNIHQMPPEGAISDLGGEGVRADIERRRRAIMNDFEHTLSYDPQNRVATVETRARTLPSGVVDRMSPSPIDYFPDTLYLGLLDSASAPDAVWLVDEELWGSSSARKPPSKAAGDGNAAARSVEIPGAGQTGILAMRVQVTVPLGSPIVRRFAFGYAPGGGDPMVGLTELRGRQGDLAVTTAEAWRDRLIWAAVPGQPDAGAIQREIAWSSYNLVAGAAYSEHAATRVVGLGGAYRYLHGFEGTIGDLGLIADALTYVDANLARDTLTYALSTQHNSLQQTAWRFPYGAAGVDGAFDLPGTELRSDAYFLLPAAIGRYVGISRDFEFINGKAPYWPISDGEVGTVAEHLERTLEYASNNLGLGARGLIAMGTGDYADGLLGLASEEATPLGSSSAFNAGIVAVGFPLLAETLIVAKHDVLAQGYNELFNSQASALANQGYNGEFFVRGFVDSGNPLTTDLLFLEPQVLAIVAGLTDEAQRDALLGLIAEQLESGVGARNSSSLTGRDTSESAVQIGGVWPVSNAWLTEAYAQRSVDEGWASFVRNTLTAHAEAYPDLWYGVWTGPSSYNGPNAERPGEAYQDTVTSFTDYPAATAHVHAAPIRALFSLLGITPNGAGIFIAPRMPTETFSVVGPHIELRSTPRSIGGSITANGTGDMLLEVMMTSGMRQNPIKASGKDGNAIQFTRNTDTVEITLPVRAGEKSVWLIEAL